MRRRRRLAAEAGSLRSLEGASRRSVTPASATLHPGLHSIAAPRLKSRSLADEAVRNAPYNFSITFLWVTDRAGPNPIRCRPAPAARGVRPHAPAPRRLWLVGSR